MAGLPDRDVQNPRTAHPRSEGIQFLKGEAIFGQRGGVAVTVGRGRTDGGAATAGLGGDAAPAP